MIIFFFFLRERHHHLSYYSSYYYYCNNIYNTTLEDSAFSPTLLSATRLSTKLIPKELPDVHGSLLAKETKLPIDLAQ